MKTRKLLSIFLSIVMLISIGPIGAMSATAAENKKNLLSYDEGTFEIISSEISEDGFLVITLVAKNCIGLIKASLDIEYDSSVLTFAWSQDGVDGEQVAGTKSNKFVNEYDDSTKGILKTGIFFKTYLSDKSTFDGDAKKPGTVDINAEEFKAVDFIFSVNDTSVDKLVFTVNVISVTGIEATGGTYTVEFEKKVNEGNKGNKCGDNLTWTLDSEGILTISGTGEMYNTDSPFKNNSSIKKIIIEEGVTSIGNGAFFGCSSLTSVNIPDSVTIIDSEAFSGCSSLASVNIPKSVTKIDFGAFYGCEKLTEVYYTGSKTDWNHIKIGEKNDDLTKAKIYFNAIIDNDKAIEISGTIYSVSNITASDIIKAAGSGTKILKVDGTKLKSTEKVGSGMTLVKPDGTKATIIVKGDNTGDGEITASDARFALRTAVSLENPNNWQKTASDVDGEIGVTAADARLILRAAVNLEKLNLY